MMKAIHEAKERTSWISPDEDYEQAVEKFIQGTLREESANRFLQDVSEFVQRLERGSLLSSLSSTVLKLTAPGVPDLYQGQEFWDDSLVDPDNRRPVDYRRRWHALQEWIPVRSAEKSKQKSWPAGDVWKNAPHDSRLKMYVLWKCLQLRKEDPVLFETGAYRPLEVQGPNGELLCTFARTLPNNISGNQLLVVVPRLCQQFQSLWLSRQDSGTDSNPQHQLAKSGTTAPPAEISPVNEAPANSWQLPIPDDLAGRYENVFTGNSLIMEERGPCLDSLLTEFPLGLWISKN